jgi:hypothetical protein
MSNDEPHSTPVTAASFRSEDSRGALHAGCFRLRRSVRTTHPGRRFAASPEHRDNLSLLWPTAATSSHRPTSGNQGLRRVVVIVREWLNKMRLAISGTHVVMTVYRLATLGTLSRRHSVSETPLWLHEGYVLTPEPPEWVHEGSASG